MFDKLPKKGLRIAHLNICSIRNKLTEVGDMLLSNALHILALSETHLDDTFEDSSLMISGYNVYRKDRNANGGGVACYVQSHLPVLIRHDLMLLDIEVLWLHIHLPHIKPILLGCCYRPPKANSSYLDSICDSLDRVSNTNQEVYFLGDMNIDWNSPCCPMKTKLMNVCATCSFSQTVGKPTRISFKCDGSKVATCIDHIYVNSPEVCSTAISVPTGCSDHNLVAIVRKTKVPKPGVKILNGRSFKHFDIDSYCKDIKNADWSEVLLKQDPEEALHVFHKTLTEVADTPWLDDELKGYMMDEAKRLAISSSLKSDWQVYCKMRNFVTKLNRKKKKLFYEIRINAVKHDSKHLWKTLNNLVRGNTKPTQSYLETEEGFLTKPVEIANHLNNYFMTKIDKLESSITSQSENRKLSGELILKLMEGKDCSFEFRDVSIAKIELLLMSCKDKPSGADNLDVKLLKPITAFIAPMVTHIINLCFKENKCPQLWNISKVVPLPKNNKLPFSETNSRPISLLPILSKIMEKIAYEQIQSYFVKNELMTLYQHAYRSKHSTATALTQMVDDWLQGMDQSHIIGAVLLDFSAAFDILNHELMLEKLKSSSALGQ